MKSISDFPVFQSTQFQFMRTADIHNKMIVVANDLGFQKEFLSTKRDAWSKEMSLAIELHSNPRYQLVISDTIIDKIGHEKATNAFRYLGIFIRDVRLRPVDRASIILWFIKEGLINMDKTVELNKIKLA